MSSTTSFPSIVKPLLRSNLRRKLGKEYYILKRMRQWKNPQLKWAQPRVSLQFENNIFSHKSLILRPLKDVQMVLQHNKRRNLELAITKLNKTVIAPEETFSFWKLVGRPTTAKGYLEGLILKQGKIASDTGGGLCQMGNLLFWMFAHSPLKVIERHRHGFDVFPGVNRKVPFGAGATLAYNYIDLQVKNITNSTFQISLWLDETHLNGELLCNAELASTYRIEERNHQITQQHWGGYSRHNQIVKIETDKNGNSSESLLVENHAIMMYDPFLTE